MWSHKRSVEGSKGCPLPFEKISFVMGAKMLLSFSVTFAYNFCSVCYNWNFPIRKKNWGMGGRAHVPMLSVATALCILNNIKRLQIHIRVVVGKRRYLSTCLGIYIDRKLRSRVFILQTTIKFHIRRIEVWHKCQSKGTTCSEIYRSALGMANEESF